MFLEEVEVTKFVNWSPGSSSAVWSKRLLTANLAGVFRRRLMEAFRATEVWRQSGVPLYSLRPAGLADVIEFFHGETDEAELADLVWGLSAIDWLAIDFRLPIADDVAVPFEFGVPRLLVEPRTIISSHGRWELNRGDEANASPDPEVFHILASGQTNAIAQCVDRAARRLKSGGRLVHGYRNRQLTGRSLAVCSLIPADRLLAAMLFPLSNRDLETIANTVLYPPETEE